MRWLRPFLHRALSAKARFVRRTRSAWLGARWNFRANKTPGSEVSKGPLNDVFERLNVLVINLDSRPDRLEEFRGEMARLGISSWKRLAAVDGRREYPDLPPFYSGSIGCSLSHVLALEQAQWDGVDALLICEDDVEFLVDKEKIGTVIEEFLANPHLAVLALYGRARGGSHRISANLRIVVGLVGTVCYVIKPHMANVVGDLFSYGVNDLLRSKRRGKSDILWHRLQERKYFFAAPIDSYTRNREGFSDIEGRLLGPR